MKNILALGALLMSLSLGASQCPVCSEPTGLENTGNACFINSALQAYLSATELATISLEVHNYGSQNGLFTILRDVIHSYRISNEKPLNPELLHNKTWDILKIPHKTQDDANYALITFLEYSTQTDMIQSIKDALPVYRGTTIPKTDLSQLFYVESFSVMDEPRENFHRVNPAEASVGLIVKVNEKEISLMECLEAHFATKMMPYKIVDGKPVEAQTNVYLEDTQNYVCIMFDRRGQRIVDNKAEFYRVRQPLSFPLKGLDFTPYFHNMAKSKGAYELISVIMHSGTSDNGGHYTAYAKRGSRWYYCNDSSVTKISNEEMVKIANRGYGATDSFVPTTFIYELSCGRTSLQ